MLNIADHKTGSKSLDQAKELYKMVDMSKIITRELCMIADISMWKKIRIQNQSIIDHKIQTLDQNFSTSSWILNSAELIKDNNRITLKEIAKDLHAHTSTEIL